MKNLKKIREAKGLSQKQVALDLHLDPSRYSKYERGDRQLPPDMLIKLANYFNVTTDYILGLSKVPLSPEQDYVIANLDDPDKILNKNFILRLAGEKLTEDEARKLLEFLKILRDI